MNKYYATDYESAHHCSFLKWLVLGKLEFWRLAYSTNLAYFWYFYETLAALFEDIYKKQYDTKEYPFSCLQNN